MPCGGSRNMLWGGCRHGLLQFVFAKVWGWETLAGAGTSGERVERSAFLRGLPIGGRLAVCASFGRTGPVWGWAQWWGGKVGGEGETGPEGPRGRGEQKVGDQRLGVVITALERAGLQTVASWLLHC